MSLFRFYLGSRDVWQAFAVCFSVVVLSVGLAFCIGEPQAQHKCCPCPKCSQSPEEGQ